ncbi:H-NS histone family protein [Burkholderia sp. SCN-KJ]|uniref:H-NS histone family protein n=1 Tax=Burkholderia sp. SCN-KJ TaxID=2969248 RepID=UPI0021505962|nr:H-NS histone family protein [Burkholderia sp. SCN-KJ]MCR4470449.1 H-NS histone family protein [Burkholderia sp. SCN-KJ]
MVTLEVIQSKIAKLQKQAETMVAKQASAGLEKIRELMEKHGLTVADVESFVGRRRGRRAGTAAGVKKAAAADQSKRVVPAKYLNPKTGETWSGRGRAPAWIKDVKNRSLFLIDAANEKKSATQDTPNGAAAKRATAKKAASKTPKAESKPVKSARATAARKQGRPSSSVPVKKMRSRRSIASKKTAGKTDAVVMPKVVTEAASE